MTDKNLPEPPQHLSSEEFREHGHALIDWIADYWDRVENLPVMSQVTPGTIRDHLPSHAPETGEPFENLIRDLDSVVMPGITHWQHPSWFAFFPANASPPSVLAELASAGLGVQGMLWSTSPAATEIESHVLDWLVDLLDLPTSWKTTEQGGGVLQMSASDSTHTALVVARHQAAKSGISPDSMVAYASTQTHSSIQKGATVAGYGHVRLIDVDDDQAMRFEDLRVAIDQDRADGLSPIFVAATIGTTGTTGVDPIRSIGEICRDENLWLHIDAAYAGNAMLC
ncbi:MAG TPA: pyridoxal-dependent decarboxylase, partial [Acidimicrobiales bacterium]|nr:pyridoxal-dependent decarboxylase [Acidimicrobiales bacterium]